MSDNRIVQSCYISNVDYEFDGKLLENVELDRGCDLNIRTLHAVLEELIKCGYEDYSVSFGYDSNCAATRPRNQFDIHAKSIMFKE